MQIPAATVQKSSSTKGLLRRTWAKTHRRCKLSNIYSRNHSSRTCCTTWVPSGFSIKTRIWSFPRSFAFWRNSTRSGKICRPKSVSRLKCWWKRSLRAFKINATPSSYSHTCFTLTRQPQKGISWYFALQRTAYSWTTPTCATFSAETPPRWVNFSTAFQYLTYSTKT